MYLFLSTTLLQKGGTACSMNAAILLALMSLVGLLIVALIYVATLHNNPRNIKCSFGKFSIESTFATKAGK